MKSKKSLNFEIKGGKELSGEIKVNTAKNSAVALLCASLINKGKTILRKVPRIEEVFRVIEVLESVGVRFEWLDKYSLRINPPEEFDLENIDREAAIRTRSVIMLIGPLVNKLNHFKIPQAGGCKLGSRTVKPHFYALDFLGVDIKATENDYEVKSPNVLKKDQRVVLYESGDTVTENLLMAAALIPGRTEIRFASANYQIQDLCNFLKKLGVKIEGIGSTNLIIEGVKEINENIEFTLSEDPIEAMLFLSIAITTNSEITIKGAPRNFIELELLKLEKMGFHYEIVNEYKSDNGFTDLVDIKTKKSKLKALEEKIYARPFPGLNIDNLPFFVPIATRAEGQTLIHDWVYENRAIYYMELVKLGADMILADPHRVYINGPTNFKPADIICPPALRPAAIILIGMLAASGESILRNVYSISRGYEDLAHRLKALGASIEVSNG
jgi:UDP-N-acetylglucosamine 1-carboxyvinyltransferase